MAILFVVPHRCESNYHGNPVHVIRDHGAIGRGVLPTKEGIEDTPAAVEVWVTAVDMPDALADIV